MDMNELDELAALATPTKAFVSPIKQELPDDATSVVSGDASTSVPQNTSPSIPPSSCTTDSKKTKKKDANRKEHACQICGLTFAEMPKGSKFCFEHRTTVNAARDQVNARMKKSKDDTEMIQFKEQQENCGPPPSTFSCTILQFEAECPSLGPGKGRKAFDFATPFSEETNTTRMKQGFKCIAMHKERACRFWVNEMDYPPESALKKWDQLKIDTPEDDQQRDEKGPPHSKLQLPVQTQNYNCGENESAHTKGVRCEGKKRGLKSEEELEAMRKQARTGHAALTDEMFKDVGGNLAKQIAREGGSGFLNADGSGAFGIALSDKKDSGSALAQDLAIGSGEAACIEYALLYVYCTRPVLCVLYVKFVLQALYVLYVIVCSVSAA